MAKMGRPQIAIDQSEFEYLCGIQCTLNEIAGFFKCSPDTIQLWVKRTYEKETFTTVFKRFSDAGLSSLRRKMFLLADKNAAVCIFLAKNYLNMTDQPKEEVKPPAITTQFVFAPPTDNAQFYEGLKTFLEKKDNADSQITAE